MTNCRFGNTSLNSRRRWREKKMKPESTTNGQLRRVEIVGLLRPSRYHLTNQIQHPRLPGIQQTG